MDSLTAKNFLPDFKNRKDIIYGIAKQYKNTRCKVFSKSLCMRDIYSIEIGNTKEQVLFVGAFHGMEWLTSMVLLRFAKNVCESIKNKSKMAGIDMSLFLKRRGILIIPCINPDGVEISLHGSKAARRYQELVKCVSLNDTSQWQANARGVDLNHNFPAGWDELHKLEKAAAICGPAPTRYGGEFPGSEPEVKSLINLCKTKNFRHALAFHSQGEEIYWDFGEHTPPQSKLMANAMANSSGYKVSEPEGLAVGGGFKDWFIDYCRKPGFTIEIGKGKNPLPMSDLDSIYSQIEEMLVLSVIM